MNGGASPTLPSDMHRSGAAESAWARAAPPTATSYARRKPNHYKVLRTDRPLLRPLW